MRPQANFARQLAMIAVFASSCVLILVFLWTSFGGTIPLKPKSYRVTADFPEASNLTVNADVRISGVTVGHVISKNASSDGTTHAVLELEPRYADRRPNGGWDEYIPNLEVIHIPGDHLQIVDEPRIGKIGADLTAKLAVIAP